MAVAQGAKPVKKAAGASKSSPSHPPYIQMITEALVALKERTGSSHYAIAKHIEEEQKIKDLPSNFKKLLFNQLKKFVASGKLVMVKKSFKLPPKTSAAKPAATETTASAKPKAKPAAEKKAKRPAATKPKAKAKSKSSLKVVKSPIKKKAAAKPVKAKKPKSIKSPIKKAAPKAKKAAAAATKKAKK